MTPPYNISKIRPIGQYTRVLHNSPKGRILGTIFNDAVLKCMKEWRYILAKYKAAVHWKKPQPHASEKLMFVISNTLLQNINNCIWNTLKR